MKHELPCAVVRDLLPNYIEGLTSPETSQAVEAHLAVCPDCATCKDAMLEGSNPSGPNLEQEREVDYLKTVKRRSRRRIWLAILCTIVLFAAGFALKVFVIGTPAQPQELSVIQTEVDRDNTLHLSLSTPYSATAYWGWKVDITDDIANISARSVLVSPLFRNGGGTVAVPLDGLKEIRLCGQTIWRDGTLLSREIQYLYHTKTPYVGDASALNNIASALKLQSRLCSFTNSLQTSQRPYGWTLELETTCSEEGAALLRDEMSRLAPLMLALVENLDQVSWTYTDSSGKLKTETLTLADVNGALSTQVAAYNRSHGTQWEALDSVKDYVVSEVAFQHLCEIVSPSSFYLP